MIPALCGSDGGCIYSKFMKVGRNEPCPCGSGRKFKKCHGLRSAAFPLHFLKPSEAALLQERLQAREKQREKQQGLGRPIISTKTGDIRAVAVAGEVFLGKWKTFHDFLFHYLLHVLGEAWWNSEASKQPTKRHPLFSLNQEAMEQLKGAIKESGTVAVITTTGALAAILDLAYSLYLLGHNVGLQTRLIARLKNADQFFGAHYEASVAGILIRAGFEVEVEDESDVANTHCEFTATYRETGRKFSVEAKQRAPGKTHVDVGSQLHSALRKNAQYTRIVFIEVNVPHSIHPAEGTLAKVLAGLTTREQKLTIDGQPAPPAYVILTNNPFLYHRNASFQTWAAAEGFKIPDFKLNSRFSNLREALTARERHRELFGLMDSMRRHDKIPSTFDGGIPQLAAEQVWPRLLVGNTIRITHDDGSETVGTLKQACVVPENKMAFCFLELADGKNVLEEVPLTEAEIAAYRDHPDTFFGRYDRSATGPLRDPLDLYDWIYESFSGHQKNNCSRI